MIKSIKRSFRIPKDIDDKILEYCERYNFSYSKVILIILESFVYADK